VIVSCSYISSSLTVPCPAFGSVSHITTLLIASVLPLQFSLAELTFRLDLDQSHASWLYDYPPINRLGMDTTIWLLVYTTPVCSCTYHDPIFIPTLRHYALYPGIPHSSCIYHFGSGTQKCICIYMLHISCLTDITNSPLGDLLYNST
jgi:hypothetical protein